MRHIIKPQQRGDTLIEVMLAITIVAIVVVSINGIMNRGLSLLQLSVERSQVRASMQGQIDALRYMRDVRVAGGPAADWQNIITNKLNTGSPQSISEQPNCGPKSGSVQTFYINESSTAIENYNSSNKPTSPPIASPGKWMWIEAYKVEGHSSVNAIDFAVRACWEPPTGGSMQHETTIGRLYYV